MIHAKQVYIWVALRISLGLIFLWAFIDKLFCLGLATSSDKSWLSGGSPTQGFLLHGTEGPFASMFQAIAGNIIVDWIFMLGLLLIGSALILGIYLRLAGYAGTVVMFLMWLCVLPPEHHPFLDEHIIYGIVLIGIALVPDAKEFSLSRLKNEHET